MGISVIDLPKESDKLFHVPSCPEGTDADGIGHSRTGVKKGVFLKRRSRFSGKKRLLMIG